jgi:DNA-binding transcriptional regulator YdaS (Cro superfamily)
MKLADWFERRNPDGTRRLKGAFAVKIGVSPSSLTGYCNGAVWPPRQVMENITRETVGDVTANDFMQTEAAE